MYLREKHPSVFLGPQTCNGVAYVDTPLLTMSCGMVAMSSDASLDPFALIVGKLQQTIYLLQQVGVSEICFVFDGPTREEKVGTCIVRQQTIQRQATKRKRDEPQVQMVINPLVEEPEGLEAELPDESVETKEDAEKQERKYSVFPQVSAEHQVESDLYISSMITNGKDVGVLKELSKFAFKHLTSKGVRVLQAPHDSESFIAQIMTGDDVAYTCDSDALPFGCTRIVQYLGTPKETWIYLDHVLQALKMDLSLFRKFCVMLGSDFNPRLPKCGPAKVQQCIQNFSSFEKYCRDNAPKTMTEEEKELWINAAEKSFQVFCTG